MRITIVSGTHRTVLRHRTLCRLERRLVAGGEVTHGGVVPLKFGTATEAVPIRVNKLFFKDSGLSCYLFHPCYGTKVPWHNKHIFRRFPEKEYVEGAHDGI